MSSYFYCYCGWDGVLALPLQARTECVVVAVSHRPIAPPMCEALSPAFCLVGCVVSMGFLMVCSLCCKILTSIPSVSTRALVPCVCSHKVNEAGMGGWQVLSP